MLDIALEHAGKADASRVGKIYLAVGSLCGFEEECIQFYFDFLSKGTIAEGAELSFDRVQAMARCNGCGNTFELGEFERSCPRCGGDRLELIAGRELFVESIEVEQDGDKGT